MRSAVGFLLLLVASPSIGQAQSSGCSDFLNGVRSWWLDSPPANIPTLDAAQDPDVLIGRYRLELVATVGSGNSGGVLVLTQHPTSTNKRLKLTGYIEDPQPASWGTPVPVTSAAPDSAGVELWSWDGQHLSLEIGNPGSRWTDPGIGLDIFQADSSGFQGRWVSGAAVVVVVGGESLGPPQGYFCATRLAP